MSSSELLPPLHRAILLTVLYGDLFDHPLTAPEIHRLLAAPCRDRDDLDRAIDALQGRRSPPAYLSLQDGFVCWRGRESTVQIRLRRQELAVDRWRAVHRFGGWLSWVPFLRMVAVCGSQAMENGDERADVDLFLVTEPERLWLVQSATMVLRRAGRLLGADFCPNYLLTTRSLEIEEHNLYTAREATQVVPLWGRTAYDRFLAANRWTENFLPQGGPADRRRFLAARRRHRLTTGLEWLLGGWLGHVLDRGVRRVLLAYYRLRLRRHGWGKEQIERAYRRDRQVVVTGGYAGAVARRFLDHAAGELGDQISDDELERWFFGDVVPTASARESADPLYAGLMARRYGSGC